MFGGLSRRGPTAPVFFEGRLTAAKHRQNLPALLPSVHAMYPDSYRFLQDNDTAHAEKTSQSFLMRMVPRVLKMPAQSPDFNAVEHLWSALDRHVAVHHARTIATLKTAVAEEWAKVTVFECNRIIDDVQGTLRAMIAASGEYVMPAERRHDPARWS
eukprot:TRINITY_DN2156_c1_g1_i1.p1 TRINITY_DN2156_c1_g1~~TRINITY_DN2156_c1_g1_i1.p1  ORF type:complete len:157 (-),score=8.50 TRINITY_DN2156_c1_g1_i1:79-549(-)